MFAKISSEYIFQTCLCEFEDLKGLYGNVLKIKFGPKAYEVKGNGGNYH
jgi:hypothetical protein